MHTAISLKDEFQSAVLAQRGVRPHVSGKFLQLQSERFLIRGATYGTFSPDHGREQFPPHNILVNDFDQMVRAGINTVRTYTAPTTALMDAASEHGLRVMAGLPWAQHIAFADDRRIRRNIRHELVAHVRRLGSHPAMLLLALGNEIPAGIVRWHGRQSIERFLKELYEDAKSACPEALFTYVNYPTTEYLELPFVDVCAFNVYVHDESKLRAYIARLQHIAGHKPLLMAEAGADSLRHGLEGQAALTSMQLRAAFAEGACGAIAFAWTDEWWRGGFAVEDWAFGLVDAGRKPKPALAAVSRVFAEAPFASEERATWPHVSIVVCAYNAAQTIDDCLSSLRRITYPSFEVIVVNDGSKDATGNIARRYPFVRVIDVPNGGLSATRNIGMTEARGEIVAYTDADVRVEPDWLTYLVQPFLSSDVVGVGGPNVVPPDDPWLAQCVARSPGGPIHVLLDDRIAEHVPGCNMAFRRDTLVAIGGFNPIYLRAGDDVDVCWRLQAKGWKIGFAPAALVWHHHRPSVRAFWRQQVGYGEGETWLIPHHPDKFAGSGAIWRGRIYSPLPFVRSLSTIRIHSGVWGTAGFPSIYFPPVHPLKVLPHSAGWMLSSVALLLLGALGLNISHGPASWIAALSGAIGLAVTSSKCLACAGRSDIRSLASIGSLSLRASRAVYRLTIAWLHILQPLARWAGRLRGRLRAPEPVVGNEGPTVSGEGRFETVDVWRALVMLAGSAPESRFWSQGWTTVEELLTAVTDRLRTNRISRVLEVDDGWRAERDVSVAIGRWAWLDLRVLVEDHGAGQRLARVAMRMRPNLLGIGALIVMAMVLILTTSIEMKWGSYSTEFTSMFTLGGIFIGSLWRCASTCGNVRSAITHAAVATGFQEFASASRQQVKAPARTRDAARHGGLHHSPEGVAQASRPIPFLAAHRQAQQHARQDVDGQT